MNAFSNLPVKVFRTKSMFVLKHLNLGFSYDIYHYLLTQNFGIISNCIFVYSLKQISVQQYFHSCNDTFYTSKTFCMATTYILLNNLILFICFNAISEQMVSSICH